MLIIATLLLCLNYSVYGTLYFKCVIKELTGYDCPACGAQRAVASLLEGNFVQAFWYNPYLAILLPFITAILTFKSFKKNSAFEKKGLLYLLIAILGLLMVAWTIVRNLPIWKDFVETQLAI